MKYCIVCGQRQREPGLANYTTARDEQLVVVRHVPAEVCANCGEAYFDEETASRLSDIATAAFASGGEVVICEYEQPVAV